MSQAEPVPAGPRDRVDAGVRPASAGWAARLHRFRRGEGGKGLTIVSPAFIYALIMLAAPLTMMFLLSFWTQDYLTLDRTFTLANYEEAWTGPLYQLLMLRSLVISGLTTFFTVLLAYPVAYFVAFEVKRSRALWLFLIT
ncbi:MAG TPA: hypothetical protein VFJ13_09595, partial [Paracoccaceae bacterium]|nr:hypothetical protein [Paracoccaceae bacterium]